MFRLFAFATALALALVLVVRADDEKKDEKDPPKAAETPKEMFQELVSKFRSAKGKDEQEKLFKSYVEKFLAYADKNKDDKGMEALLYVTQIPAKGDGSKKAIAALKKDYARTAKLGNKVKRFPLSPLMPNSADMLGLVKEIAEHNTDKPTRAYAYRSLSKYSEQAKQIGARLKDNEDLKENLEKQRGKEALKAIEDAAASADKDIKAYKEKLEGDLKGILLDISEGKSAPEVVSEDLEGKKVKLSQLKGKVVVLDFWATWCGPCKAMIPHTKELVEKMKDKPFVFISVSADEKKDTVKEFIKKTEMPWTHWWSGPEAGVVADWDIEAFPTIVILDAKGVIRKKIIGGNNELIDETVSDLVKEIEKEKKKDK